MSIKLLPRLCGLWLCTALSLQAAVLFKAGELWDPEQGGLKTESPVFVEPVSEGEEFSSMFGVIQHDLSHSRLASLTRNLKAGHYEKALEMVRSLSNEELSRLDRTFWEARLLLALDRPSEAVAILEESNYRSSRVDVSKLDLLLGLAHMQAGKWSQAEDILLPLTSRPQPLDDLLVQVVFKSQQAPKPMGLDKVLRQSLPGSARLEDLANAAVLLFRVKDFEQAAAMARRAVKLDPLDARSWHVLGSSLQSQGLIKEAGKALKKAIEIKADYPEALGNLGLNYYKQGQKSAALLSFVQALERDIHYLDGWGNYLTMLSQELVPREELEPLPKGPGKAEKAQAKWHWEQGVVALDAGEAVLSVRHFLRSLSLDLNDPNVHNDMAVLLVKANRKVLALPFLRAASFLTQGAPLVEENLQQILQEVQQASLIQQVEFLHEKISKDDKAVDRFALAVLHQQLEQPEEALVHLQQAVNYDPNNLNYLRRLTQHFAQYEQPDKAINTYQHVLKLDPDNPRVIYRMAWLLLVQPKPDWRDLKLAEQLARESCELTDYQEKSNIDLLARVLEANGKDDEAKAMREKAEVLKELMP